MPKHIDEETGIDLREDFYLTPNARVKRAQLLEILGLSLNGLRNENGMPSTRKKSARKRKQKMVFLPLSEERMQEIRDSQEEIREEQRQMTKKIGFKRIYPHGKPVENIEAAVNV